MTDEPTAADWLHIDLEHFDLTAQASRPLQPRDQVEAIGAGFPGFPVDAEVPTTDDESEGDLR